jgi:Polyketide cyclase / dehydrase and lipid transport
MPLRTIFWAAGLLVTAAALAPPALGAGQEAPGAGLSAGERAEILKGYVVLRELPNPGKTGRTFEARGVLPCGLDDAFGVITNYARYPEFMPQVDRTEVRPEGPGVSIVDLHLGLPLGMKKRYRLRYECARSADGFDVTWRMIPWPEVPPDEQIADTSGGWCVRTFEGGGLLATYTFYADPGHVPLGLTSLAMSLAKHSIPGVIEKTRQRIRALSAPKNE